MTYLPDDTDTGVLGVFDSAGNLLSHQYLRSSGTFTLSYTAGETPIAYILAGFHDPGYLGALTFRVKDVTPLAVNIDINPKHTYSINMKSGQYSVAILSTKDFNAPLQIDSASLTFGRTGRTELNRGLSR
jgi:hypothetical protein